MIEVWMGCKSIARVNVENILNYVLRSLFFNKIILGKYAQFIRIDITFRKFLKFPKRFLLIFYRKPKQKMHFAAALSYGSNGACSVSAW